MKKESMKGKRVNIILASFNFFSELVQTGVIPKGYGLKRNDGAIASIFWNCLDHSFAMYVPTDITI